MGEREKETRALPPSFDSLGRRLSCTALRTARREPPERMHLEGGPPSVYATLVFEAGLLIRSVRLLSSFLSRARAACIVHGGGDDDADP